MKRRNFLALVAALLPASWCGRVKPEEKSVPVICFDGTEDSVELGVPDREWYEVTYSCTQQNGEIVSAKWADLTLVRQYKNGIVTRSACEKINAGQCVYLGQV